VFFFKLKVKNVENDLLKPAVEGTINVLRSCQKNGVKKVILTSSVAALENGIPTTPKPWKLIDETSINTHASPVWKPYFYSKLKALQAAESFHTNLLKKGEDCFTLCSIHPSAIYGPQQSNSLSISNTLIQVLISGEYVAFPPLWLFSCDVRDVSSAHLLVLKSEKAEGRYIVNNCHAWVSDYVKILRKKYTQAPIPYFKMPVWIFSFAKFFDPRIDNATVEEQTKEGVQVDGSKICRDLGFSYRYDLKTTLIDTVESMIKVGSAEKHKKWVHLSSPKKFYSNL